MDSINIIAIITIPVIPMPDIMSIRDELFSTTSSVDLDVICNKILFIIKILC